MLGNYSRSLRELYTIMVVRLAVEYHGCNNCWPSKWLCEHDQLNTAYLSSETSRLFARGSASILLGSVASILAASEPYVRMRAAPLEGAVLQLKKQRIQDQKHGIFVSSTQTVRKNTFAQKCRLRGQTTFSVHLKIRRSHQCIILHPHKHIVIENCASNKAYLHSRNKQGNCLLRLSHTYSVPSQPVSRESKKLFSSDPS
jgi:hypothetical protein